MPNDEKGALTRLVSDVKDEGVSYREMARRAADRGLPMSHATFSDLGTGMVAKAPTDQQLRAIAAGTGRPYADVRAAMFAQFYGYVPREHWAADGGRAFLPADLSDEEVEEAQRMIRAWVAARHQRDD